MLRQKLDNSEEFEDLVFDRYAYLYIILWKLEWSSVRDVVIVYYSKHFHTL